MNNKSENPHLSVLLKESIDFLKVNEGERFIDATLGMGGHSEKILETASGTQVLGLDQDLSAIEFAKHRLAKYGDRFTAIHANFSQLKNCLTEEVAEFEKVDGIIADLGVSSLQLDTADRGFSFRFDAPLDMRMNPDSDDETAAELIARLDETEIANIIYELGEERYSRRIAWRIAQAKKSGDLIETTKQLADLVLRSVPRKKNQRVHPATKTFQALRIKVNKELEILESFLKNAIDILKPNGRLVVISFHSLEDRIVKHTFQKFAGRCSCPRNFPQCVCGAAKKVKILTKRPVTATESEQLENPRSRSAKLRACRKLEESG